MKLKVGQEFNPFGLFTGVFIPNVIVRSNLLPSTDKLVLGRLFQYAGRDGQAFPKQKTLAQEVGIKRYQLIRILNRLRDRGFIKTLPAVGADRTMHKANRYMFLWHPVYQELPDECTPVHSDKCTPVHLQLKKVSEDTTDVAPTAPGKVTMRTFTDDFCRMWRRHYGSKYPFGAKDGALAAQIWKFLDQDIHYARRVLRVYFGDLSPFFNGHPLGKLRSHLPEFKARARPVQAAIVPSAARQWLQDITRVHANADREGFAVALRQFGEWRRQVIVNVRRELEQLGRQMRSSTADVTAALMEALQPSGGHLVHYYYARWIAQQVADWEGWSGRFDEFRVGGKHWRRFMSGWWRQSGYRPNRAEQKVMDAAQES